MQSVSGNSRVLDTLGLKSQVVAYDQSTNLLRAVEQLESRARQPLPVHPNVQVGAARGFTITSRSIPGARCILMGIIIGTDAANSTEFSYNDIYTYIYIYIYIYIWGKTF